MVEGADVVVDEVISLIGANYTGANPNEDMSSSEKQEGIRLEV